MLARIVFNFGVLGLLALSACGLEAPINELLQRDKGVGAVAECVDNDGDGYGANCDQGRDCDDYNDRIHAGAVELCDLLDNDCDGVTDERLGIGSACLLGYENCMVPGELVCVAGQRECSCS